MKNLLKHVSGHAITGRVFVQLPFTLLNKEIRESELLQHLSLSFALNDNIDLLEDHANVWFGDLEGIKDQNAEIVIRDFLSSNNIKVVVFPVFTGRNFFHLLEQPIREAKWYFVHRYADKLKLVYHEDCDVEDIFDAFSSNLLDCAAQELADEGTSDAVDAIINYHLRAITFDSFTYKDHLTYMKNLNIDIENLLSDGIMCHLVSVDEVWRHNFIPDLIDTFGAVRKFINDYDLTLSAIDEGDSKLINSFLRGDDLTSLLASDLPIPGSGFRSAKNPYRIQHGSKDIMRFG